jgi:hypothetical protein
MAENAEADENFMRPASLPDDTALTGSVEGWRLIHDVIVRIAV